MNPRAGASEPCDVLVLGADEHTGLAAARSLHRAGIRVAGGGLDPRGFGFRSNALDARVVYPSPERDHAGFVAAVREAALRHRVRAILPSLDTALLGLHKARQAFDGVARLGIAPSKALEGVLDKARLAELAADVGIEAPRTFAIERDPGELPPDFPLPAVVKQRRSGFLGPRKVIYCSTRAEIVEAARLYLASGHAPIVQQMVYGYGAQLVGLCRAGELLHSFQYRRVREYRCRGGLGSLAVSEPVSRAILDRSSQILRRLQWDGIVGVEFKVPPDQPEQPRLIEVNARFIGFIDLAMSAGINFPLLQYRFTVGEDVLTPSTYRHGVLCQRWPNDTLALIELLLQRPPLTGVPLPGRFRALWDYLTTAPLSIFNSELRLDPFPVVANVLRGVPIVARKLIEVPRAWVQ
jgi:predicted ATP-grasp superfamily ATP-dependent carboligase